MSTDRQVQFTRAAAPFGPAVAALIRERQIGVRRLARMTGVTPGHMSRVLRQTGGKRPSATLIQRVTEVLELPDHYFREQRRDRLLARLDEDPALLDELEQQVRRRPRGRL